MPSSARRKETRRVIQILANANQQLFCLHTTIAGAKICKFSPPLPARNVAIATQAWRHLHELQTFSVVCKIVSKKWTWLFLMGKTAFSLLLSRSKTSWCRDDSVIVVHVSWKERKNDRRAGDGHVSFLRVQFFAKMDVRKSHAHNAWSPFWKQTRNRRKGISFSSVCTRTTCAGNIMLRILYSPDHPGFIEIKSDFPSLFLILVVACIFCSYDWGVRWQQFQMTHAVFNPHRNLCHLPTKTADCGIWKCFAPETF